MGLETEKYGDLEVEFIAYGCHTNMSYKNRFIGSDDDFIKDDGFESLKKGLDDIERCYLYRDFLNDVKEIKTTINVKLNAGVEYDFPTEFVFNQFDYLIREIQNDIKSIYIDYRLKAFREGRAFYKPLPDNSYVNNPQPCEKEVANPLDKHGEAGNNNTLMQIAENTNTTNEHLAAILQYFEKWERKTAAQDPEITPGFIGELIKEGYIDKDGKTTLTELDNIAEFLSTRIENVTPGLLLRYFVKRDSSPYKLRTAQDAIKRNKTR
ncbi:hypothetical protein AGMMS49587_16070 [Spirochaetia bacterium]|nr:hypothetical protein AGMMS49587_16070 [Spirochaetia bacterium]